MKGKEEWKSNLRGVRRLAKPGISNALWASSITIIWSVTSIPRAFLAILDSNKLYGRATSWFGTAKLPKDC